MSDPAASIRVWAARLRAAEAVNPSASGMQAYEALQIPEKLRLSVTQFVGVHGFSSLLQRALALTKADLPSLHNVKVTADGRLEGLQELAADTETGVEAATAITEHLLGLLVNFIGESLTLRLLRDAWPDSSVEK